MPPKGYAYGPEKKCGRPRIHPKTAKELAKPATVAKKCGRPRKNAVVAVSVPAVSKPRGRPKKAPATPAQMERATNIAYEGGIAAKKGRGRPKKAPATAAQMARATDIAYKGGIAKKKSPMVAIVEKVVKVAKIPKAKAVKAVKAVLAVIPPPPPYTPEMKAEMKTAKAQARAMKKAEKGLHPAFGSAMKKPRGRPSKKSAMTGLGGAMVLYEKKK